MNIKKLKLWSTLTLAPATLLPLAIATSACNSDKDKVNYLKIKEIFKFKIEAVFKAGQKPELVGKGDFQSPQEKLGQAITKEINPDFKKTHGMDLFALKDFGGSLGYLVTGIVDKRDELISADKEHYWKFLVNNKTSETGISSTKIHQNDVFLWELTNISSS